MLTFGAKKPQPDKQDDLIKDTTTQNFMRDVMEPSRKTPVLVDFWAEWCGPCKQLTPILEKAVRAAKGKVRLVKMNIDQHPEIAQQLGVQSIPAVFAFQNGQPIDGFMGALPESQVKAFIDRLTGPGEGEVTIEEANAALEAGDVQGASALFAALLSEDRENADAAAGLAKCYIKLGDLKRAEQTLALIPDTKANSTAVASARAMLALAKKGAAAGKEGELAARLQKNPNDHEARFNLALALNGRQARQEALEHLLEIISRDKTWNNSAAKTQLIEFFQAWGPDDDLTIKGRRRLSSVLFS
jgi:putative thioredoxin